MSKSLLFSLCLVFSSAFAADLIKTPMQIHQELDQSEKDFEIAQKMFIPWYTGPLITGGSKNLPKGRTNIQPYLFLKTNYGGYDDNRNYSDTNNTFIVNPLLSFGRGILDWLDFSVSPQGSIKYSQDTSAASFGDLGVSLGFQLYRESLYLPGIRFIYTQVFPTGAYTELDQYLDSGGQGVFQSVLGLNLGKVLWMFPLHPMALRLSTNVQLPTNKANVSGINTYGGGVGTSGLVNVRPTFNIDFGYEISITQKWVFAIDVAYTLSGKSTFSGFEGLDANNNPYFIGGPVSDNLSLSPAIEYSPNDSGGFIGGVWFSVTGRNTPSYATVVLSYTQLF
jgi:hypothetical protein